MSLNIDSSRNSENDKATLENSLQAACARTLTRSLALYFSRPVRLFRPAKVTGWHFLRNLAQRDGSSLTPSYILSLCKSQGVWVIPKHFLPPMAMNALLGTVLWSTYAQSYSFVASNLELHPYVAATLSGAIAGGCQALVAALAENVRLLLAGGSAGHSWSSAWKEVFRSRGNTQISSLHRGLQVEEIRELRDWLRDVEEMASRGWTGWRWGLGKDACAFASFFAILEVTRRLALYTKQHVRNMCDRSAFTPKYLEIVPNTARGLTLVTGGVFAGLVYESVCRPWDRIRRLIYLHTIDKPGEKVSVFGILRHRVQTEGFATLYYDPLRQGTDLAVHSSPQFPPRIFSVSRTLARVGPWGIGFLFWEAYRPT